MKEGYVLKSKIPEKDELSKINKYTRREFTADEIYTFSVVLCDNEIDRDNERFTTQALNKLSELFLGKTGIFNHSMQTQNQKARIYDCCVEEDDSRITKAGEKYCRLVAKAYLPKCDRNNDFILELESGIKKEVSVGCAVGSVSCSICGADLRSGGCHHIKGKSYNGKICCAVLSEPTDAYEWSFVAVPAQREAGVIKSFSTNSVYNVESLKKAVRLNSEITLNAEQGKNILKQIESMENDAQYGRMYCGELKKRLLKYAGLVQPEIPEKVMNRAAENMDIEDLKCFEKAYRKKAEGVLPIAPQLAAVHKEKNSVSNAEFKI
jgi:hypothetical protein